MGTIKSATQTLSEIANGQLMIELSERLNEATAAVRDFGKSAEVTVRIKLAPQTKNMVEPVVSVHGEVSTKLPKPDPAATLFFMDENNNLTRNFTSQQRTLSEVAVSNATKGK